MAGNCTPKPFSWEYGNFLGFSDTIYLMYLKLKRIREN
jgi:hypothetical protein